eukprot:s574_g25.t1
MSPEKQMRLTSLHQWERGSRESRAMSAEATASRTVVAKETLREALEQPRHALPVTYICGNCGSLVEIKPNDAIRCRECGYRILFKMRSKKPMQYQAI